jgi:hypothetical protein
VYGRIKNEIKIENRTSYRKQRDQIALNFHQAEEMFTKQKKSSNLKRLFLDIQIKKGKIYIEILSLSLVCI